MNEIKTHPTFAGAIVSLVKRTIAHTTALFVVVCFVFLMITLVSGLFESLFMFFYQNKFHEGYDLEELLAAAYNGLSVCFLLLIPFVIKLTKKTYARNAVMLGSKGAVFVNACIVFLMMAVMYWVFKESFQGRPHNQNSVNEGDFWDGSTGYAIYGIFVGFILSTPFALMLGKYIYTKTVQILGGVNGRPS